MFGQAVLGKIQYGRKLKWSIGIYEGPSPFDLSSSKAITNPVLTTEDVTDRDAVNINDPFVIRCNSTEYMFFEVSGFLSDKSKYSCDIALATSSDGMSWNYKQIVIDEDFKLSYPNVFKWKGEYYLIPESNQDHSIRIYKATNFPTKWKFVRRLVEGHNFQDPSIFRFRDKWWLFCTPGGNDTLSLYFADDLMGPWIEHPKSPVIKKNPNIARPGGKVLVMDDRIFRFAQACFPSYGIQVFAFEITELTTTSYKETAVAEEPIIGPSGNGWNADRAHHIDLHPSKDGKRWIAYVDGGYWYPIQLHGVEPLYQLHELHR